MKMNARGPDVYAGWYPQYPQGQEWRCPHGCVYPSDYEPSRCPIHSQPLTRVVKTLPWR